MRLTVILFVTSLYILYFMVNIIRDLFFLSNIENKGDEEVIDISHLSEDPINAEDVVKEYKAKREQEQQREALQRKEAAEKIKAEEAKRKAEEEAQSNETLSRSKKELQATQELEAKEREDMEMKEAADIATQGDIVNVSSHEGCSLESLYNQATKDRGSNIFAHCTVGRVW